MSKIFINSDFFTQIFQWLCNLTRLIMIHDEWAYLSFQFQTFISLWAATSQLLHQTTCCRAQTAAIWPPVINNIHAFNSLFPRGALNALSPAAWSQPFYVPMVSVACVPLACVRAIWSLSKTKVLEAVRHRWDKFWMSVFLLSGSESWLIKHNDHTDTLSLLRPFLSLSRRDF